MGKKEIDPPRRLSAATPLTIREYFMGDMKRRACSFAVSKIDEALAVIESAYTCHEGIASAYADCVLGLENIDELPLGARLLVVRFLTELIPEPAGVYQRRSVVASLTESQSLQVVEDLRCLREDLDRMGRSGDSVAIRSWSKRREHCRNDR